MDHIEVENVIELGRKIIDVSNVSTRKSIDALKKYNEAIASYQSEEITIDECMELINIIGVDLIKHKYSVLRIRFNPIRSIIELLKRHFIKLDDIYNLTKEQYTAFQTWTYFAITGEKKKSLEAQSEMTTITTKMYQRAKTEMGLNPDECLELLMTLLKDQTKPLKDYMADRKES